MARRPLAARIARLAAGAPRWAVGLAIVAAAVIATLVGAERVPALAKLEAMAYDARLATSRRDAPDPQVAIVDIDEASLERIGRWPWPRDTLARLTAALFDRHQARLVAFDVLFPEADLSGNAAALDELARHGLRDTPEARAALAALKSRADHDGQFATSLSGRATVLAYTFTTSAQAIGRLPEPAFTLADLGAHAIPIAAERGYSANLPALQEAARSGGHLDPAFDADGVVRRVPMVKRYGDAYYPALSLATAALAVEAKRIRPVFDANGDLEALDAGGLRVPVARDGTALVPYRGPPGSYRAFAAADILEGRIAPDAFAGAIVLVGTSAKGLQDLRSSPLAPDFPGVEIHASLVTGMLDGDMRSIPAGARETAALIVLVAGLVAVFAMPWRRPVATVLGIASLAALVVAVAMYFWIRQNAVVAVAPALSMLAVLLVWSLVAGFVREARETRELADLFGEYVPPERVAQMRASGERFTMEGESREMSVLFSDVRDFTALSERLPPRELSALLNDYLSSMTTAIHARRGTVDKYVGDAIMAFWGAPVGNPRHAADAVHAALAMQRAMPEIRAAYAARGWPAIAMGVGVNTGTMSVGDMGSRFRKAYTVLGDAVNLASRLEGLTKVYGVPILCGETTRAEVDDVVWREVDRVRVKGREQAVGIHEPLGDAGDAEAKARAARWQAWLADYRARRFDVAHGALRAIAADDPDAKLALLFAARCATFLAAPPPPDWDGAWNFVEK
ncbi:MAG TPA: adenylate/guanylate cyclase domain-containing protein [Casimicrobiaceae bacterium]|nr:adenylate/guanylate cyclase domain-containing protein [Casimicrobiaceae bacterium]